MKKFKERAKNIATNVWQSLVTWSWTRRLVFWIILSAGMMSELAFLCASLWMSVNANVHPFIVNTLGVSEKTTENLTYLATTAYVALPECIVGLAVITTINHIRVVVYNPKDFWPWLWSFLYGLPAIFFLILSVITLGNAVANVNFTMPTGWVVVRAIAGFSYAFTSLLYVWMGKEQEKDRLAKKDANIAELRHGFALKLLSLRKKMADLAREWQREKTQLQQETGHKIIELEKEIIRLQGVISQQNDVLESQKKQQSELLNALDKSSRSALDAYSDECKNWLMSGIKTVSVDEIARYTGHSKRKVNNAIAAGKIQSSPRNKALLMVSSVVDWLEQNPPIGEETKPDLYVVNG